jgi:hypothetical protein
MSGEISQARLDQAYNVLSRCIMRKAPYGVLVGAAIAAIIFILLLVGAMALDWNSLDLSGHPPPWQWDQGQAGKDQGTMRHG